MEKIINTAYPITVWSNGQDPLSTVREMATTQELFESKYPLINTLGLAPNRKVMTIRRFKDRRRMVHVDNRRIAGVAATLPKAFLVRVYVEDLEVTEPHILSTIAFVKKRFPSHELVPSSDNWMSDRGYKKRSIDLLFAEVETAGKSEVNARLVSLGFHLQPDRSRHLDKRRFFIVRGESSIKDYDGWMMFNPKNYSIPFDYIKVLGIENFCPGYMKNPGITLKGIAEVPSEWAWSLTCKKLGISPWEYDGIVPEVTIKFDNPKVNTVEVEMFSVFNPTIGKRATMSLQAMERIPLLPEAAKWCAEKWAEQLNSMLDAFESNDPLKIAGLLQRSIQDLHDHLLDGNGEDVLEGTETMSSLMRRIVAGIPIDTSKLIKEVLPFATRALKGIVVKGACETVLPDRRLKDFEVALSYEVARHLKVKVGDWVVCMRAPDTGIEMACCRVAILGRPGMNPHFWASRFSGDFDGDLESIVPITICGKIVDEARFEVEPVSTKSKGKAKLTPAEATARAIRAKTLIPKIDSYLTVGYEKGLSPKALKALRSLLQAVIDSVKHDVDIDIKAALAEAGISPKAQPSSLRKILSGRLGQSKKLVLMVFNMLMERAHWNTRIPWMTQLRKLCNFRYIVAGNGDSDSVELLRASNNPRRKPNPWYVRLLDAMEKALISVNLQGMFNAQSQQEPHEYVELTEEMRRRIVSTIPLDTPENAKTLARRLVDEYYLFIRCMGKGLGTEAYGHITLMNNLVMEDEIVGGLALRYLASALMIEGLDGNIKMKAMTILGYLPLTLGTEGSRGYYNIAKILRAVGYERKTNILVGKVQ